jgi:hypothetical protein
MSTPIPPLISDAGKNCPNCGATNDPIVSNCAFCQTPLARVAIEALPEEVLLKNAALWLGRLEALRDHAAYESAVRLEQNKKLGFGIGKLASAGTRGEFGLGDINGYTEQYLGALEVRTRNSANLSATVSSLRERQRLALQIIQQTQSSKGSRNKTLKWGCAIIALIFIGGCALFYLLLMGNMASGGYGKMMQPLNDMLEKREVKSEQQKALAGEEKKRLEEVKKKIVDAISKKDVVSAKLLLPDLRWQGPRPSSHKFDNGTYEIESDKSLVEEIRASEQSFTDYEKLVQEMSQQNLK